MSNRVPDRPIHAETRTTDADAERPGSHGEDAGIWVEVLDLGDAYLLPGDALRPSLLSWQYVHGRLVYDETRPRWFAPLPSGRVVGARSAQTSGGPS